MASVCAQLDAVALPSQPQGPIIVRGLNRFLELKNMAAKQQEELRQREEKVFCKVHPTDKPKARATVPKPFSFEHRGKVNSVPEQTRPKSSQQSSSVTKPKRLAAQQVVDPKKAYTFRPRTTETSNRELIQQILNEPEDEDDDVYAYDGLAIGLSHGGASASTLSSDRTTFSDAPRAPLAQANILNSRSGQGLHY
jgi:hypothetical protein